MSSLFNQLDSRQALKELRLLELNNIKAKHPNLPYADSFISKYEDRTANGITKCVISFLKLRDWQVERINSMGRYIQPQQYIDVVGFKRTLGKGKWIKGTGTNGTADISATIWGRSIKIEVKAGTDHQSQAQKDYQRDIEKAGGIYIIVRSFADFLNWYKDFEKKGGIR
jgi:hypothetical protein